MEGLGSCRGSLGIRGTHFENHWLKRIAKIKKFKQSYD